MIIHAKPVPYGEPRCYSDWHLRGSIGYSRPRPDRPKEEEKEFIKEEEFKV